MNKPIYILNNKKEFKRKNLENWFAITDLWQAGEMRHIYDLSDHTAKQLKKIIGKQKTKSIVDIGCGEGWILRLLLKNKLDVKYTGIDFNPLFIENLKKTYKGIKHFKFLNYDIENKPPKSLINSAHLVINFFNFFEIPQINIAFKNTYSILKKDGILMIVTIDPVMQILAVSKDYNDFRKNLILYQKFKSRLGYDKKIDLGSKETKRIYRGILYSISDYIRLGKELRMTILNYEEIIRVANKVPQIYQYLFLQKKGGNRFAK
jgi:SAM-dependent methyltransferase